jgi:thiamine biosynthesis lipoprotein
MGTRAQLAKWSTGSTARDEGLQQLEAALSVLEQTERQLSTWRDDSEISAINQSPIAAPRRLPDDLCGAFAVLARWTRDTDRAFDPAIGRLTGAWDLNGTGRVPARHELIRARSASVFDLLGFDAARCTITRSADVAVDVGGWGKGEALDRASRLFDTGPWMIDLGGQIAVGGAPPGEAGWPVAIAHPLERDRPYFEIRLREGSLSTSGGSERDLVVHGRRIGHILDPRTGQPAQFHGSVTVWHRSALAADILSTALFVMGPADGVRWAEARELRVCYLAADPDGRVTPTMTAAFRTAVLSSESVQKTGAGPRD